MSKSKQAVPEAAQTHEPPEADKAFEALLLYLKQSRGFDFTAYKRSTLMRRVLVRMQTVGMGSFSDYLDYLQVDSNEFTRLFNTILINVTSFFRDPAAWEFVTSDVIPSLLEHAGAKHPQRGGPGRDQRRGKPMRVKVTCTQLAGPNGGDPQGVILLMEEADGKV